MKISVPTSLADINIRTWKQLSATTDEFERIAILCGISASKVKRFDMESMEAVSGLLSQLEDPTETQWPLVRNLLLSDVAYGFIPNLSDLTVGEYADVEKACQLIEEDPTWLMSILYRPIKERHKDFYSILQYTAKEPKEPFEDMTMDAVFGAFDFFLRIGLVFSKTSLQSLKEEERVSSQRNGVGTRQSTTWLKEMLSRLRMRRTSK